jgi:hypothetical protein
MAMPMTQFANPQFGGQQFQQQMPPGVHMGFGPQFAPQQQQHPLRAGYDFGGAGHAMGGVNQTLTNINNLLSGLMGGLGPMGGGGQQQMITPQSMGLPRIPSVNEIVNGLPGMPGGQPVPPPMPPQQAGPSMEEMLLMMLLPDLLGNDNNVNNSSWDDNDDWDWDDDDDDDTNNNGGGGNNTSGTIIDTAEMNDYNWSGSSRTINFEGNLGDNDFDVRQLDNSVVNIGTLDEGAFDSGDRIRLNVPDDNTIQIAEETTNGGAGKKFTIKDANGNVIVIHTDGQPNSIQGLLAQITDANNNPLDGNVEVEVVDPGEIEPDEPDEPTEPDPDRPAWLPVDYDGEHYDPEIERGFREIGGTGNIEAYGQIVQFDVNTNFRTDFTLTGDQAQFISHISRDARTINYNIDATNSRMDIVVGKDDWIKIDHDPDTLVAIGEPEFSDITGAYQMTFFDPNTGNLIVLHADNGEYYNEPLHIVESKLRGRFKGPGE